MDFRGKKQVIINGKAKSKLFYEDRLIWSKLYEEFSKDFKNLVEGEEFFGNYDSQKACLLVSNKFIRLAPIIEFEGENHDKVEYGENFEMPRVRAYSISGGDLEPSLEIYRDGVKVDKVDTKIVGKYELRYIAEKYGKTVQTSYYIEVWGKPKYRYIRDWLNGSPGKTHSHWIEIQAFDKTGENIALKKPVTPGNTINIRNSPSLVTDGNTYHTPQFQNSKGENYVLVDLQKEYALEKITVWHYWGDGRKFNTRLEISLDGKDWITLFDSAKEGSYSETKDGKTYIL